MSNTDDYELDFLPTDFNGANADGDTNTDTTRDWKTIIADAEWKHEHEKILVDWADKAMCYRWMHSKSHQVYSRQNAWYTVPVIIMSTLTGTANFAQESFPANIRPYAPMMIGAVNIFAGILTTIQQFLKISELNEAHRVGAISWDKFYRNIKIELAKCPDERIHVSQMLKISKEEFDRLMETSPSISDAIIARFGLAFADKNASSDMNADTHSQRHKNYLQVCKPEICNELVSTENYRYKTVENLSKTSDLDLIRNKQKRMEQRQKLIENKLAEQNKVEKNMAERLEVRVSSFIHDFTNMHNRKPMKHEVIENLQDTIPIETLDPMLKKISDANNTLMTPEDNSV